MGPIQGYLLPAQALVKYKQDDTKFAAKCHKIGSFRTFH